MAFLAVSKVAVGTVGQTAVPEKNSHHKIDL